MHKRILLLTFFFPPDLSAGSFRAQALVQALSEEGQGELHIDVVTTQPNRYVSHAAETHAFERQGNVSIHRMTLPQGGSSGFLGQAKAFVSFAWQASRLAKASHYDVVFATSSRLMTAVLGAHIAGRQGAKLYLDIRDIFVENLKELFSFPFGKTLSSIFGLLERYALRRADKISLVSAGFFGYFEPRYPGRQFSLYPNGVDDEFLDVPTNPDKAPDSSTPLQVLYAGNIGDGQALHLIVPALAEALKDQVHFRIVGAGGRLSALQEALVEKKLSNVELLEPVDREKLLGMYQQADVLFLHLNNFDAFHRVLPSKIFEYAATGKPVWAGVAGYPARMIGSEVSNAAVFAPCDLDGALAGLNQLRLQQRPRPEFVERYARGPIMRSMAKDILALVE